MNEFTPIKAIIDEHRKKNPKSRRYPKEFWQQVLPLAKEKGVKAVAKELGISHAYLYEKLKRPSIADQKNETGPFVQIPFTPETSKITLELPHNIKLSIQL